MRRKVPPDAFDYVDQSAHGGGACAQRSVVGAGCPGQLLDLDFRKAEELALQRGGEGRDERPGARDRVDCRVRAIERFARTTHAAKV